MVKLEPLETIFKKGKKYNEMGEKNINPPKKEEKNYDDNYD